MLDILFKFFIIHSSFYSFVVLRDLRGEKFLTVSFNVPAVPRDRSIAEAHSPPHPGFHAPVR